MTTTQTAARWQLKGTVTVACNCDYGCPCNFNARPTYGHCEGEWTWHVADGRYGETPLSGLHFTLACDWPAAIHEGNGEGLMLIDERASAAQRQAIQTLVSGQVGGPWGILSRTLSKIHGPVFVPYEVKLEGVRTRVKAGQAFELEMEPIRNPVTGAEAHPRIVLPEGLVWKDGSIASSKVFRVAGKVTYDHSGKYAALSPFEYSGPPAA
jgi:hypothetical protein